MSQTQAQAQAAPSAFGFPPNGIGGMYGGNFVDILFKHILEHGWAGFTWIAILNFYMYMSLDKIKDMLKLGNEKLVEFLTKFIENHKNTVINAGKNYVLIYLTKLKDLIIEKITKKNQSE